MIKQLLDGMWQMKKHSSSEPAIEAAVPGSVYTALLDKKLIPDPYAGENQYEAERLSEDNYIFSTDFETDVTFVCCSKIYLRFEGIDTLSDVFLNGVKVGSSDNMHRIWEFDVTDRIIPGNNKLEVRLYSPVKYIKERNRMQKLWGVASTMEGYPHLRKAHYMFGWDWGPVLPDMGIWRSVSLIGVREGRIDSVYNRQTHTESGVTVRFETTVTDLSSRNASVMIELASPDGDVITVTAPVNGNKSAAEITLDDPQLWFPGGYGGHPLYRVTASLIVNDCIEDVLSQKIGLRKIEICRTPDNDGTDGEEFAFSVNGVKLFAMGANYIPEDQLICRRSAEATRKLLSDCLSANYNMIRVWGGGIYPDDWFYDFCDENGLLVWQDCMFACSVYSADRQLCESVKHEMIDNVKRLRNHASLAMWCGNNEIESAWQYWGLPKDNDLKKGYLRMFEVLIPKVISYYDPETFYWPSSPSSGGGFNDSGAHNKGDIHYWDVWHGCKPFTDYSKYTFRFCSEYGFESIPCMKTIRSFADDKDMNLMSPVMEAHQKCEAGNEKLMYYIAQMTHYPYTFEGLIYASQIVQADAIRLNVENMRRQRGKCMGSLYWQVNDSNPVISWSSIDYFGRWKALHYYARRFYAPVLVSADMSDENNIVINVSNEKMYDLKGTLTWRLKRNTGDTIASGQLEAEVPMLSARNIITLERSRILPEDRSAVKQTLRSCYLEISLVEQGVKVSSAVCHFVQPKSFEFLDPKLSFTVDSIGDKFRINISAAAYAKGVCLELANHDVIFSDNWFDIHGGKAVVFLKKSSFDKEMSESELADELSITSYYTAMGLDKK